MSKSKKFKGSGKKVANAVIFNSPAAVYRIKYDEPVNKSEISSIIENHFNVILEDDYEIDYGHNDLTMLSEAVEVIKWRDMPYGGEAPGRTRAEVTSNAY